MNIEKIATNTVESEILKYGNCLEPYISSNDKTPIWDGEIYVYKDNTTVKEFEGSIKVQVKGHTVDKIRKGNSKFRIETKYLEGFQKDRKGTLLFVVEMTKEMETQIFYKNLLPVDLKEILNGVRKGQKTVTFDIKPIKEKTSSNIKLICLNFLKNSNEQLNAELRNIENVGNIKDIRFNIITDQKRFDEFILNNDIYLYGTEVGTDKKIAFPKPQIVSNVHKINASVKISKEYYKNVTIVKNKDKEYIELGKALKIYKNDETSDFEIKFKGNIYERINDMQFIIELIENEYFYINEKRFNYTFLLDEAQKEKELETMREKLKFFLEIKKVFEKFNIFFDVDMDKLTSKDWNNLKLFTKLNNGKKVKDVESRHVYNIEIANYKIAFLVEINENVRIHNFYSDLSSIVKIYCLTNEKKEIIVSPYLITTCNDLITTSNVNTEVIKNSMSEINDLPDIVEKYNLYSLEVLKAYDKTKNIKWLELAEYINEKISRKVESISYKINTMQIIKRKRAFTKKEIREIYEMKETDKDNAIQCAIAILLDNKSDFEWYFEKMTKEQKEYFRNFPIYNLIKL